MAKEKKEKIIYIDDGRTIADMSGVTGGFSRYSRPKWQPSPRFREVWQTYWMAVKMMIRPMLVVIAGIGVIYLIMYVLFGLM